jgi:glycerophosphoryl diester phosphodiesterase
MRKPWVIAHRGASGYTPENTLAAFERAVQLGAGFIETDLHLTRDAQFVAIHDATLERTTNGRGAVRDFTLAELRRLDAGMWFDREYMGQRIPTLDEVLEFARKNDVIFYLEVKYDAAWGMHHSLVAALQKAENAARTIVISFDQTTLAALRRVDASVMMGLLADEPGPDYVKDALELGARQMCPQVSLITPDLVQRAHGADLQVATWTVNDAEEMRRVIAAGVDGIMTNFPDRLGAVIEDMQAATRKERRIEMRTGPESIARRAHRGAGRNPSSPLGSSDRRPGTANYSAKSCASVQSIPGQISERVSHW